MKKSFKFLFVLQIICGILLIVIPLYALPNIRTVTEEPPDISMIIESLHGASPTPKQVQRAADLLVMERRSLAGLASASETGSRGLEYLGVFFIFSGIVLLIENVKLHQKKDVVHPS